MAASGKKHRADNPDIHLQYSRKYNQTRDREAKNLYLKEWKAKNRDKVLADKKQWDAANKEHIYKYNRRYATQNPEVKVASEAKRRALKLKSGGSYTSQDIKNMLSLQGNKCNACKIDLVKYHVDHVIPLSRGGTNYPDNLQILCVSCNCRKSSKLPSEWKP